MKRIRRHVYFIEQIKKIDGKLSYVRNEDGSLFSGVYKTKIFPADLPECYLYGQYYKRAGYMSTKGIVHMKYFASKIGTFLKDDFLLISYHNPIELNPSEPDQHKDSYWYYRGYDEVVYGNAIITILAGAEKFSDYDIEYIKKQISSRVSWLKKHYPQDYDKSWTFNINEHLDHARASFGQHHE